MTFVEDRLHKCLVSGREIPKEVHMSIDIYNMLCLNAARYSDMSSSMMRNSMHLKFHTAFGELSVKTVLDRENYLSVGGIDYVTNLMDVDFEKEFFNEN